MTKLSLYLATLLFGSNFSASTPPPSPPPPPAHVYQMQLAYAEQQYVDMVNTERLSRGLGGLTVNGTLVQVAREHSREMYEKNYFDHISPTPELRTPMTRYLHTFGRTPTWAYLGENLFYCSIVDVQRGHVCLMNSPRHRQNILNKRYEQIGVGIYVSPDGQFFVTQMFLAQVD